MEKDLIDSYGGRLCKIADRLTGAELAFVGDGVFDLLVREYLVMQGVPPSRLHGEASGKYVSADAQFEAYKRISGEFTQRETEIFTLGRNSEVTHAKKKNPVTHCHATGLEALFGYLYLRGETDRLNELFLLIANTKK